MVTVEGGPLLRRDASSGFPSLKLKLLPLLLSWLETPEEDREDVVEGGETASEASLARVYLGIRGRSITYILTCWNFWKREKRNLFEEVLPF